MKLFPFLVLSSVGFVALPAPAQQLPAPSVQQPAPMGASLRAHLQLKAAQIEALNVLYDNWITERRDFVAVQTRALQILTPLQRAQLDSIVDDSRLRIRDDQYSQLLLTPLRTKDSTRNNDYRDQENQRNNERQRAEKQPGKSRNRNRRSNGSGSYGVYGGYSYGGPNYGVYGNYGQGNVGVGATIGRYGPSIGVNVGRVFGGRWLR